MNTPLKILALNHRCQRHPNAGGSEVNLFEQAKCWVQQGHDVTIVAEDPGRDVTPTPNEVYEGINIIRMGNMFTIYALGAYYAMRHGHEYDVILDIWNGIPFFTKLVTNTPVTLMQHHIHGPMWFTEFTFPINIVGWLFERYGVRFLYRGVPIITVSATSAEELVELGFDESRLHIIHNGIITDPPPESAKTDEGEPPLNLVYVGRIKKYKRLDHMVEIFAGLTDEFPNAHLHIAGAGDALEEVESTVERLGLQQSVTLHGFISDEEKARLLHEADVFVTPSLVEGWGLSVIEANTYGTPAVAYAVPGLSASIRHGQTGLLAHDDEAFQRYIASILRDETLRETLGHGAKEWALNFRWDISAKQTIQVMAQTLRDASLREKQHSVEFGA